MKERSDKLIKKDREISRRIKILKAAESGRVSPEHPGYADVVKELGIRQAGFNGELALDYYLSLLPDKDVKFFVFHDLRLPYKDTYFQIDTLILFLSFYLILESKNYRGTLSFDPKYQQVIQEVEDNPPRALPDPILQVKRQSKQFQNWLRLKNLPLIPGENLVVLTNPKAIIKVLSEPRLVEKHVIKSLGLSTRVELFLKKHSPIIWCKKELRKCSSLLLKDNTPLESNPLEKYNIKKSDILKGVFCPKCQFRAMGRIYGKWKCPRCLFVSEDAHIAALNDYRLLISPSISNKEICDFLGIKDAHTARRLIQSMNLDYKGDNRQRIYILPSNL